MGSLTIQSAVDGRTVLVGDNTGDVVLDGFLMIEIRLQNDYKSLMIGNRQIMMRIITQEKHICKETKRTSCLFHRVTNLYNN